MELWPSLRTSLPRRTVPVRQGPIFMTEMELLSRGRASSSWGLNNL